MQNTARRRPEFVVSADGTGIVSQAGGVLLTRVLRATGLDAGLSSGLGRWKARRAVHDPGKIIADLAVTLALGGDCLADIAALRAEPQLFGPVASDPVVSRLISVLAADAPRALKSIRSARAAARERAWELAGNAAPGADGGLVTIDIDATIVTSCSEKAQAAPTWKKTYGFHPLTAFADHGADGSGEPLAFLLRPGNAGSNTASEHIDVTRLALAQLPRRLRRRVLIRSDSGGGTHDFLTWLAAPGRRLAYSVGFAITDEIQQAILAIPANGWAPAYDAGRQARPGAWVAEITGMLDLSSWPKGMRVIIRRERPHPGAQLRFTDIGGHRFTCLATSTKGGQLADLELRHRRRARCEDRIRAAKDTGLRNLPLHGYDQNKIWTEIVALACELLAWTQMLALTGPARRWEPKRLRLRVFSCAGHIVRSGRRLKLRLATRWPWASQITAAIARLHALEPG
jgi:Transposase DDE domain group 1